MGHFYKHLWPYARRFKAPWMSVSTHPVKRILYEPAVMTSYACESPSCVSYLNAALCVVRVDQHLVTSCVLSVPLPVSILRKASIESFTPATLKFGICMHYIFTPARTNPLNCGRNCQDRSCRKVRALSSCIACSKEASQSVTQVHAHTHAKCSKSAYE